MSRRTALIVTGIAAVILGGFLLAIDPAQQAEGNPSIVDFEFAWSEDGAEEILAEWGEDGRDAARLSLWVDFAYIVAYGSFLVLASFATRDFAVERGRTRLAAFGMVAIAAATVAPICDAIEDMWLLVTVAGPDGDLAPRLGALFASAKFATLAIAIAYLVWGLVARLRDRGARAA